MAKQTGFYPRARSYQPALVRFEQQYVPEPNSGCWIWIGSCRGVPTNSRPVFFVSGHARSAHRFALETFKGPIPNGMMACHTCHNAYCVNPDHLYAGTPQQNTDDMMRAGRHFSQNNNNPDAVRRLQKRALANSKRRKDSLYCIRGHLRQGDNVYFAPSGRVVCKECRKIFKINFRLRQKAKAS